MDVDVACVIAGGLMDLLCAFREQEAFHLYDEVLVLWSTYIGQVRAAATEADPDSTLEALRVARDVLDGIADQRQYRAASPDMRGNSLTPQEQFVLFGEAPEDAFPCRNCGDYTLGFSYPQSPQDWMQGDRVACCSKSGCFDAWKSACRVGGIAV